MDSLPQEEDEIKDFYTYQDWWEGKVFFGPFGQFSVDAYFDSNKRLFSNPDFDPSTQRSKAIIKTMSFRFPPEEFEKIKAKQEELFYAAVEKTLNILKDNFLKRFRESENKPRLLQLEVETYEKLFYEEKFAIGSIRTNTISLNLGNRSWSMVEIGSIRDIYQERIVNGKKDFIATPSPNCHFGFGGGDQHWKQVEAYAKYFDWIKKFKMQMTFSSQENKYFSYTFSETYTGIPLLSKHQLVFREIFNNPDKTLSYKHPDDNTLTSYFLNQLAKTDALEIEDFLSFHYDQYTGNKNTWLRFVESRWIGRITDYKTGQRSVDPDHKYIQNWLNSKMISLMPSTPMKENLLEPFEKTMDITKYFVLQNELESIKNQEDEEIKQKNRRSNISVSSHDFTLWVISYYQKEAEKIHQVYKSLTQEFDNYEKVKTFINQQYAFIKALLKKNAKLSKTLEVEEASKFIRLGVYIGLGDLKTWIEEEYETFLDHNDQHQVTFDDFEHEILHRFSDLNENIYFKNHVSDCAHHAHTKKEVEEEKPKKLLSFKNRYLHIVRNWIAYNKELGNNVSEKDFIGFALNRFSTLFRLDNASGKYLAVDHTLDKYEFASEFHELHLVPLVDSITTFLKNRLSQLEFSRPETNSLPLLKWLRNDVDLLEFVTAFHLAGAINNEAGNLTRAQAIDYFKNLFGIEIKDAESKLSKATDRKRSKHPFLDELVKKFAEYCDQKDAVK